MTVLHSGGKFDKESYKVSGGLHGVGVSCVNALSSYLRVEVHRDGKIHVQEYQYGKPTSEVKITGETNRTGTEITFEPDNSIFSTTDFNYEILAARLRELAFLNKGINLSIIDERESAENGNGENDTNFRNDHFYSKKGLKEFVEFLDATREKLIMNTVYIDTIKNEIPVEIAL